MCDFEEAIWLLSESRFECYLLRQDIELILSFLVLPITNKNVRTQTRVVDRMKTGDIRFWKTSNVTNMSCLFINQTKFNENLEAWDVSRVTDMSSMFLNCREWNQPIGKWDVSNVVFMTRMFKNCLSFRHDLSGWEMGQVIGRRWMFRNCVPWLEATTLEKKTHLNQTQHQTKTKIENPKIENQHPSQYL